MATGDDGKDDKEEEGIEFTPLNSPKKPRAGTALDTEGGTLFTTGRLPLNKLGSGLWYGLVRDAGLEMEKAACKFGVNEAKGIVSAYPVDPLKADQATPFGLSGANLDRVTLHLGEVFDEKEDLRPAGKRSVVVSRVKDTTGTPCLAVYLNIAQKKRRTRRTGAGQEAKPEQAAAPGADPVEEDDKTEE